MNWGSSSGLELCLFGCVCACSAPLYQTCDAFSALNDYSVFRILFWMAYIVCSKWGWKLLCCFIVQHTPILILISTCSIFVVAAFFIISWLHKMIILPNDYKSSLSNTVIIYFCLFLSPADHLSEKRKVMNDIRNRRYASALQLELQLREHNHTNWLFYFVFVALFL